MYCPTCGRENTSTRKFCIFCGTNLEAVSQVLSGEKMSFFTRIDMALDQLTAKYAEHVFDDAPAQAIDRRVANSWKILGKGITTSFVDLFLSLVMWNVFAVKFDILLLSSPFRLLSEHSRRRKLKEAAAGTAEPPRQRLPENLPPRWLPGSVASITEYTTERLQEYSQAQDRSPETD